MERWARVFAIAVAGLLVAGPVFAQSAGSGGNTTSPKMDTKQPQPSGTSDAKSDAESKDKAGSAPSASPGTSGTGAADKSDAMKSSDKAAGSGEMKSGAAGAKGKQVREAQQALKDKGHDPGPIDGVMGPKTQAALREFQKAEGIQTTGRLDAETMSKLGVASAAGQTSGSSPAASPKTGAPSSSTSSPSTGAPSGASGASDASKDPAQQKK